jgi:hypothetical protein
MAVIQHHYVVAVLNTPNVDAGLVGELPSGSQ